MRNTLLPSPTTYSTSKILMKIAHPFSELVVSLNVNHGEDLLSALADKDYSTNLIIEAKNQENVSEMIKE
jgi:hypothetical protein